MSKLYLGVFSAHSHQPSNNLFVFSGQQFECLALQLERAAYVSRKTQWLPQNRPKQFIQRCSSIGCCYDLYCHYSLVLVERYASPDGKPAASEPYGAGAGSAISFCR